MKKALLFYAVFPMFLSCEKDNPNDEYKELYFYSHHQSSYSGSNHYETNAWIMFFDVSEFDKIPRDVIETNGNCLTKCPLVDELWRDEKITLSDGRIITPIEISVRNRNSNTYSPKKYYYCSDDHGKYSAINDFRFKIKNGEYVALAYKFSYGICDSAGEKYSFKKITIGQGTGSPITILFPTDESMKGYFEWEEF